MRTHNKSLNVLVEKNSNNIYSGYDQYFNRVDIESNLNILNSWVEIDNAITKGDKNVAFFK